MSYGSDMTDLFDPVAFGRRLRKALEKADLSLRRAEPLLNVDHATLGRTCCGKPPSVENYLRIVKWLSK